MTARLSIAALAALIIATQGYIILHLPRPLPEKTVVCQSSTAAIQATVTAYTARRCETNDGPIHTATMEKPKAGWTCAVSRDLMHWLGGRVYVEGVGVRRVNDLMNDRYTERIDVFCGTVRDAKTFGVWDLQVVFLGR
ncbi:MAG: 3D domain-containing protein [Deltaproteobacteria bacterium]|nr:3D domain-containing protein [Deltaproteobacteria bacterium]